MASSTPIQYKGMTMVSVQVPNDSAVHQVYALMLAANKQTPVRAKYITIQNDPKRSQAFALFGEKSTDDQGASNPTALTSANYGVALSPGGAETFGGYWGDDYNNITRLYVLNDGTGSGALWLNFTAIRG